MKKSAIILSMMLVLSVFTFAACGNSDNNANNDQNGTTMETTDGNIVDDAEKDVEDIGDDVKDGAEDVVDDTEDMLDGNDSGNNDNTDKNNVNQETKQ